MKITGAVLLLLGALGYCLLRRREGMLPLRLGRALLRDLALLHSHVCLRRTPLPQILEEVLTAGLGAVWLWEPLANGLRAMEESSLPQCWTQAVQALPSSLGGLLAPLGPLLPQGGERLGEAIEETREELARFLREETARQADQRRVTAGLCLAGVCLVILVLL